MAERLGLDPQGEAPIPFDIADPAFTRAPILSCCTTRMRRMASISGGWIGSRARMSGLPGLDPLWWLNHLHFYDLARDGR